MKFSQMHCSTPLAPALISLRQRTRALAVLFYSVVMFTHAFAQQEGVFSPGPDTPVMTVGEQTISMAKFVQQLNHERSQRFYHAMPPKEEVEAFVREVLGILVDHELLLVEATSRGIEPDPDWVSAQVDRARATYTVDERSSAQFSTHLPELRVELESRSRVMRLEQQVRDVGEPGLAVIEGYYRANPDLFTQPERLRISLILLGVPPSSPVKTWRESAIVAGALRLRLLEGEEFAALARDNSTDPTAESGGDMGFVHEGMLGQAVQRVLRGLEVGEISEPQRLLEGYAIYRLDERIQLQLQPFTEVQARAALLWRRETEEAAWSGLLERLRHNIPHQIDERVVQFLISMPYDS